MLSIAFLGISDLPRDGVVERAAASRWCVQVRHGAQHRRTKCVELADLHHTKQAAANVGPERCARRPLWDEEVEVHDREGEESVEIAVISEAVGSRITEQRESTARINMSTFRHQPDKRTTFWVPLRPAASHVDEPLGAIEIAVTYISEDCVTQGYVFALFCGLVPLSWMDNFLLSSPWRDKQDNRITDRVWSGEKPLRKKEVACSNTTPADRQGELTP